MRPHFPWLAWGISRVSTFCYKTCWLRALSLRTRVVSCCVSVTSMAWLLILIWILQAYLASGGSSRSHPCLKLFLLDLRAKGLTNARRIQSSFFSHEKKYKQCFLLGARDVSARIRIKGWCVRMYSHFNSLGQ